MLNKKTCHFPMPTVNELMTVDQLIDLVAYLQGQYRLIVPVTYPDAIYSYGTTDPT